MTTRAPGPRRALFCAPLPPEFDRESGSRRIYHLLQLLRAEGWTVVFVCENAPEGSPHVRHLRQLGVATYVGFDGHTADLVEAGDFDLAVFAFWYLADRYAPLIRRLSPRTRIVVETVDLHWLRSARRILGRRNGAPGRLDERYGAEMVSEMNAYAEADGVFTVSEKEADLINDLVGEAGHARAIPDYDEVEASTTSLAERRGIVFVGNFRHPPNLDAVEYLCEEILPFLSDDLLRAHPVRIVGNGPNGRVHELADAHPHVEVVGWVPSVVPELQAARVSVVPIRYGAGTKRKLIQSLLAGTPAVSTSAGAEGIDVEGGRHLLVADDAPGLADGLRRLLTDEALWTRIAEEGRTRVERIHGRAVARSRMVEALAAVMSRAPKTLPATSAEEPRGRHAATEGVRRAVDAVVPPGARVLVVSKGDPELVDLPGCEAEHFPQAEDGRWAGYHPRDSKAAVAHLDALRGGADFFAVPSPSFWWLDYYKGFAHWIGRRFERVWSDDHCVIFRLGEARAGRHADAPPSAEASRSRAGAREAVPARRERAAP